MLAAVALDDVPAQDDEGSGSAWLHPDDRLWRHPSEMGAALAASADRDGPRLWLVALLAGIIGSTFTTGLVAAAGGFNRHPVPVRSIERVSVAQPTRLSTATVNVVEVAERVRPAIAKLSVSTDEGEASGSGVVFREDGHILTNQHVVRGARKVVVEMADGKTYPAQIIGSDSVTDVAVVKIEGHFAGAVLGTAKALKVGQQAIAIGSPLGLAGGPSLSVGVISAIGREVGSKDGSNLYDMIQTDAPIAPGSSGGALLDSTGAVIGITTAIAVDPTVGAEGLGFATPVDIARDVAEQIITTGQVHHVWLGIEGTDLDRTTADRLGIDGGVLVRTVRDKGPAALAGLKDRDVIVSVDGKRVTSMGELIVVLRAKRPGDSVSLSYLRDTSRRAASAKLTERPQSD